MAIIKNGILGGFSGTVGTVVGSTWKGIDCIRSRATRRRASNTPAQLEQRAKFALAIRFLQTLNPLLSLGYKGQAVRMTEANSALAYTLRNAITGSYPDYRIDHPSVQVTRGSYPNAASPVATAGEAGLIRFNWTDNTGIGKAAADDQAVLVAYCEALNQTVYLPGSARSTGEATLSVPSFSGREVHTWISFIAKNNKDISASIYTGQVNVV